MTLSPLVCTGKVLSCRAGVASCVSCLLVVLRFSASAAGSGAAGPECQHSRVGGRRHAQELGFVHAAATLQLRLSSGSWLLGRPAPSIHPRFWESRVADLEAVPR